MAGVAGSQESADKAPQFPSGRSMLPKSLRMNAPEAGNSPKSHRLTVAWGARPLNSGGLMARRLMK